MKKKINNTEATADIFDENAENEKEGKPNTNNKNLLFL